MKHSSDAEKSRCMQAFESMEKQTNEISGRLTYFPCVEAIIESFKKVYEGTLNF